MFSLSFVPLAGVLFPVFILSNVVLSKPIAIPRSTSFSVDVRGTGVRFLDGDVTADNVGVSTSDNEGYFTNITLGGLPLTVVLDTGSSDLWVDLKGRGIELRNNTNLQAEETFGLGSVVGNIAFADLQLGEFTINSQAFLSATQTKDLSNSEDGILGMSFNSPSSIQASLVKAFGPDVGSALGNTPMPALFTQQPDLPDSFDVQLGRTIELEDVAPGLFIIGNHDDNFQQITNAPPLPSVSTDHWSAVMDAMLINGKPFTFNASRIDGVPEGKVAAVLDTGFSLPPLPPPAVDAIYSTIPGAVFDSDGGLWIVPCNASTNLTFVFGGQEFPVHPLDLTLPVAAPFKDSDGNVSNKTVCVNTYQYLTLDPTQFVGFDLILGDAFLRNAYVSFNYGDAQTGPFMQLMSTTTDLSAAQNDFVTQRAETLSKLPPTIDPADAVRIGIADPSAQPTGGAAPTNTAGSPSGPLSQTSTQSSSSTSTQGAPTSKPPNGSGKGHAIHAGALGMALSVLAGLVLL
ncbi:acid protease [Trametes meyenii]|nr:acid protease [Trametes meyenii]